MGTYNPTARDPPIFRKLIAARELNIPICDVVPIPFVKHEWELDLVNNFAVAFEFAIAELVRSLFRGKYIVRWVLEFYRRQNMLKLCFDSSSLYSPSEE